MLVLLAAVGAAPTDEPTLREGLERDQVSPGLLGFLLTFFIVILTFFLIRDMVKRIRRVRYREQVLERAEQEKGAERESGWRAGDDGDDSAAPGGNPPGGKHGPNSDFPDEKNRD